MSKILFLKTIIRFNSIKSIDCIQKHRISYYLTKLNNKKVIGVNGKDSYDYIQGLVTNDMRHLCPTPETSVTLDCIHSFMLNSLGRVITDVFIYKYNFDTNITKQLFIEIDSQLLPSMAKMLKTYKIGRKVDIKVRNDVEIWALFPSVPQFDEQSIKQLSEIDIDFKTLNNEELVAVRDPRLKEIGFRLLVLNQNNNEIESKQKIETFLNSNSIEFSETDINNYNKYRYRLGVGEGVKDFPVESCFPLECNGDFLHAISFHKGCYVGQELTARIYHTGVIRKRYMPIEIIDTNEVNESIGVQTIASKEVKNLGKFISNSGNYGLALLRFEESLKNNELVLNETGHKVKCFKPFWWPKEYSKESLPSGRAEQ